MYLLPGNPFLQAVEAYRDSGEALCSKGMQAVTPPFIEPLSLFAFMSSFCHTYMYSSTDDTYILTRKTYFI